MEHFPRKNFLRNLIGVIIFLLVASGVWFFTFANGSSLLFGSGVTQISPDDMGSSTYSAATATSSPDDDVDDDAIPAPAPVKSAAIKKPAKNPSAMPASSPPAPAASDDADPSATINTPVTDENIPPASSTPALCAFPNAPAPSRQIIFNEIAWMGSPSSSGVTAADASKEEWIELKNISANDVDLSGWELSNVSGKINVSFGAGDTIAAGGFFLLTRNTSTSLPGDLPSQKIYSGDLVNTGDVLVLQDAQCGVSDFVDASAGWPAGNNTTKQTLERNADHEGWHTSAAPGGTPGAENSVSFLPAQTSSSENNSASEDPSSSATVTTTSSTTLATSTDEGSDASTTTTNASDTATVASSTAGLSSSSTATSTDSTTNATSTAPVAPAHLLIAAIQLGGASSTNDFIRIYNPTATSIDASGWKLHKRSQTGTDYSIRTFPAGSTVAPGQYFTWANSAGGFSEAIAADVSSSETLAADNSAALLDASDTIIDAIAWGSGSDQYGEGSPYPTSPAANQILSRNIFSGIMVDTGNNASDFTITPSS